MRYKNVRIWSLKMNSNWLTRGTVYDNRQRCQCDKSTKKQNLSRWRNEFSFWAFLTDKEKDFCSRSIPKSLHSYIHRRLTRHNNCAALYTRDWEESEKKLGSFVIVRIPEKPQPTIQPNLTARLEIVQDFHFRLDI